MIIKMCFDSYDEDLLIWRKNDVFVVDESTNNDYYITNVINNQPYGVDKNAVGYAFEVIG